MFILKDGIQLIIKQDERTLFFKKKALELYGHINDNIGTFFNTEKWG